MGEARKIYFDGSLGLHSLYGIMLNNPPKGYEFINKDSIIDSGIVRLGRMTLLHKFKERFMGKCVNMLIMKNYLEIMKKIPKTDFTFSAGHIVTRNEPWVADCEHITSFTGWSYRHLKFYRKIIEKFFSSANCKKIMPWTEAGKMTLLYNLNCKKFKEKIETVHLAVEPKNFIKKYDDEKIKLLFVGTINPTNISHSFLERGGFELLNAFQILNKKYDIELIIRAKIPQRARKICSKFKNIKVFEEVMEKEKLDNIFQRSDIFVLPSHITPGMTILDAMSYELPVITTDLWGNPEMVREGYNGYLIAKSKKVDYFVGEFIPNWHSQNVLKQMAITDKCVVNDLVDSLSFLINNSILRHKMGIHGRMMVECGDFSLFQRNKKLKKIFEEVVI